MIITRRMWGSAMLAGGLGMAAGCAGLPLAKESLTDPGALIFNGYSNPNANCFECHNGDGTGKFPHGPNLHDEVPKASDAEIATTIRKGKSIMPAYEGKLSDAEIATLGTWLRATYGANFSSCFGDRSGCGDVSGSHAGRRGAGFDSGTHAGRFSEPRRQPSAGSRQLAHAQSALGTLGAPEELARSEVEVMANPESPLPLAGEGRIVARESSRVREHLSPWRSVETAKREWLPHPNPLPQAGEGTRLDPDHLNLKAA